MSVFFHHLYKTNKCLNHSIREKINLYTSALIKPKKIVRRNAKVQGYIDQHFNGRSRNSKSQFFKLVRLTPNASARAYWDRPCSKRICRNLWLNLL